MKFATPFFAVVLAGVGAVGLAAQDRPILSGTWIGVGPQKDARELSVKQDDSTLSFDGGPDYKGTFRLDGSETKMSAPDGKSLLVKAAWKGKTLVVTLHDPETKQDIRRQTWAITTDGQLAIETEFLGGRPQTPTKEVFKRR